MKKSIKLVLVVATIVALPIMAAGMQDDNKDKEALVDFIEYCRTCENLRQVNPAKDYTKASLHELKSSARFYEDQENFADCTDYQHQAEVNKIIGRTYAARVINK